MRIIPADEFDPYDHPDIPPYPWDNWLSGDIIAILPGEDFNCEPNSMRVYLRRKASQAGLKIATQWDPTNDGIIFCAYDPRSRRIPYLPASVSDFRDYQVAQENHPRCSICNEKLTPLSAPDGVCMYIDPTTRKILPKHDTETTTD